MNVDMKWDLYNSVSSEKGNVVVLVAEFSNEQMKEMVKKMKDDNMIEVQI